MTDKLQLVPAEPRALAPQPTPADMMQQMIQRGVTADNVAAFEQLVKLSEHMEDRNAEREFAAAFVAMQSEMKQVKAMKAVHAKDGTVKYKVATPEQIDDQARPIYQKHGFAVSFDEAPERPGKIGALCILQHKGGHEKQTVYYVTVGSGPPGASEPQADGSAHSYARRGALCGRLNIVIDHCEEDDPRNEGGPITPEQATDLRSRVKNLGKNEAAFLKFAGAESFETVSSIKYPMLDEWLKKAERLYMEKLERGAK